MRCPVLSENQAKRLQLPYKMLLCFAMFVAWQMGFIYFASPSLVVDGRTPLPISMDNITILIVVGYLLAIIFMILQPHQVVWAERISTLAALFSILGLFLPLAPEHLTLLVYVHVFFCCFMIGFETFIVINLFSEETVVMYLTLTYSAALFIIAIIQNDIIPVSFSVFRVLCIIMLIMMLYFFFHLPTSRTSYPIYSTKNDNIVRPRKLLCGIYVLVFVACIIMLAGSASVAHVPNGVSIAYFADAFATLLLFVLYKKANIHPIRSVSLFIGFSVIGFLFLYLSVYQPALASLACVLIGLGFIPCQLLPMYGFILMKQYPSRYIAPTIMILTVITVLIQSTIVELFRSAPNMLHLVYMTLTVVLAMIYLQLTPYLLYTMQKHISLCEKTSDGSVIPIITKKEIPSVAEAVTESPSSKNSPNTAQVKTDERLASLTKREREVLDLIGYGYSNGDIARLLFISEHTVKDHTKSLYRKLNVHSRHAAAQIINRSEQINR